VLQCVAVRCRVLQSVAVCCSVGQYNSSIHDVTNAPVSCVAMCCSALQCVAVRCSVLQCGAVHTPPPLGREVNPLVVYPPFQWENWHQMRSVRKNWGTTVLGNVN